jgi:hypothetical protein
MSREKQPPSSALRLGASLVEEMGKGWEKKETGSWPILTQTGMKTVSIKLQ